jgi:PAS domain S-box-containing protein
MKTQEPDGDFLQAAFDALPSAIVVFDGQGRYTHANAEASHIMGAPVGQIIGRRVGEFTSEENQGSIERLLDDLSTHGEASGVHHVRGLSGEDRVVRYRARSEFMPGMHIVVSEELPAAGRRLSPREVEIMTMMARGLNGTKIAEELTISRETVRTHIRNAMEKLQARTRPHAIALAAASGEIPLSD